MQRHLANTYAKGRERIINGRSEERWYGNDTSLASALDAERVQRRRRLNVIDQQRWYLSSSRQQVIHEAGVDDLSLFIIYQSFKECSPNTLRHSPMHLSLNHHGIDDTPAVMHGSIFHKSDIARNGINLDYCAVNATGKTSVRRAIEAARLQAGAASFIRQRWTRPRPGQLHRHQFARILSVGIAEGIGGDSHLPQRQCAVRRISHEDFTIGQLNIFWSGLK